MNNDKKITVSLEALFKNQMKQFFETIDFCLEKKFYIPSLTLIFSGIDAMAWLFRSEQSNEVTRQNFIKWVEKFMQPENSLDCKAIDLYAARCSILHSFTYESRLTQKGSAKQICYTWGSGKPELLQKKMDVKYPNTTVVLSIENLFKYFREGTLRFLDEIKRDPSLLKLFNERMPKYFISIPENLINK